MNNFKTILGIETSCDETSAAVLRKDRGRVQILSNIVASSASLQAKYGGIIPEQAAREQLKSMIPVIKEALQSANLKPEDLDAIAVTQGPGLIGSLLVGVETAKSLSLIWNKPLIPINHLIGHFYANWIKIEESTEPKFPCIGLLVSGGHSDLVLFTGHNQFTYLGGTRDDAAGECFDKSARLLGLPYPGGPQISKLAKEGSPKAFNLPRPLSDSNDFDFSFSGLKTAVSNLVADLKLSVGDTRRGAPSSPRSEARRSDGAAEWQDPHLKNLCASIEQAIVDSLIKKTLKAAKIHKVEQIIVAGGVAANQKLINDLKNKISEENMNVSLHVPPSYLCTDNAAMIASAAFFQDSTTDFSKLEANPNLSLAY